MELTAVNNPQVKAAAELKQKKYRQQRGLFLAEGLRTVEESVAYRQAESIYYTAIEDERTRAVLEAAAAQQVKLYCVSDAVLKKIADTETPQGIIAVCKMQSTSMEQLLAKGKMLLVLDRVGDPGNVGTILRSADWFGVSRVYLSEDCADIYNPKVVQASMGSLFRVKISVCDVAELCSNFRSVGKDVFGTVLDGEDIYRCELPDEGLIVMGNESRGISEAVRRELSRRLRIPSFGGSRAESLNVAVATAVTLSIFRGK